MVIMTSYIDLTIKENRIMVAQDWFIYQYRVIISGDLRYFIEEVTEDYKVNLISSKEMVEEILELLKDEFAAQQN